MALEILLVTHDSGLATSLGTDLEAASQGRVRVTVEPEVKSGFDVILLDAAVPFSEEQAIDSPIVLIGESADPTAGLAGLRCGAQDYLSRLEARGAQGYRALRYAVERHKVLRGRVPGPHQKMEVVGRLAAGVVHDFRHLVQIVIGNTSLLQRLYPEDPDLQERLREVREAAFSANALIQRLLAFAGSSEPRRVLVKLERALALVRPLLGQRIRLEVHDEPSSTFWASETDFDQILLNLIVNSVDAMPGGGSVLLETDYVHLTRSYGGLAAGAYARMSVSDTGQGIPPELCERVLEPFFTTKAQRGTGLGLSTVHALLHSLGGGLLLASEPGQGTTVQTFFPTPAVARVPAAVHGLALLLEPDNAERLYARHELERVGCEVLEARTLDEARRLCDLAQAEPDLLVVEARSLLGRAEMLEELAPRAQARLVTSSFSPSWLTIRGWIPPGWSALARPWDAAQLAAGLLQCALCLVGL